MSVTGAKPATALGIVVMEDAGWTGSSAKPPDCFRLQPE